MGRRCCLLAMEAAAELVDKKTGDRLSLLAWLLQLLFHQIECLALTPTFHDFWCPDRRVPAKLNF